MNAPKQSKPIEGISNFRDLGGYTTASGSTVRLTKVYRSNHLANLNNADIDQLGSLQLKTIVDLRSEKECKLAPSCLPQESTPSVHLLPVSPKVGASLQELLENGQTTGRDVKDLMVASYRSYARDHVSQYRKLIDLLIDENNLPLVFHCSAGKDRTGFGAAIILTALGVPHNVIIDDYLFTNQAWQAVVRKNKDLTHDVRQALMGAHTEYIDSSFKEIEETFGSMEDYLQDALELTTQKRAQLLSNLVERN